MLVCVRVCVHKVRSTACYDRTDKSSVKSRGIVFRIVPEQKHIHSHGVGGREGNVNVKSTESTCSLTDRQKKKKIISHTERHRVCPQ